MKKIGIIAKKNKKEAVDMVAELAPWLAERGITPLVDRETAAKAGLPSSLEQFEVPIDADAMIVLGGDGTLLLAARLVGDREIPILGVNLGNLGFLTEIAVSETKETLSRIIAGDFRVGERMMLEATVTDESGKREEFSVLNDVVVNKGNLARTIRLEARVNGAYLTVFNGDGLIVATPTGSTAYSLSAGGPIVHPTLSAVIITPICPHTLTNRPIVVPDSSVIEVSLVSGDENVSVTLDGQVGTEFSHRHSLTIRKARRKLLLIEPPDRDYFEILRTKLNWGR
jgi:NAD+ kinase